MIAAINAVIALVYYARIAKTMWMDPLPEDAADEDQRVRPLATSLGLAMTICAAFVLVAGVLPAQLAGSVRKKRQRLWHPGFSHWGGHI